MSGGEQRLQSLWDSVRVPSHDPIWDSATRVLEYHTVHRSSLRRGDESHRETHKQTHTNHKTNVLKSYTCMQHTLMSGLVWQQ